MMHKPKTYNYSDKAMSEGFSLGTLAFYILQLLAVGFAGVKAAQWLKVNDSQTLIVVMVAVVGYLAYAIAKMASAQFEEATARAEEAERTVDALQEKADAGEKYADAYTKVYARAQALIEEKQALAKKLASAESTCTTALLDLASAKEALERAHKAHERALENASALQAQALEKAQKEGKSEALRWRTAYEALRREVDEANAQKEVQALTATVRNRFTSMTGRIWSDDIKAKHNEQLERLRTLGVDVSVWEVKHI
jgi:hypothetical protein